MQALLPHPFVRVPTRVRRGAIFALAPLAFAMMLVLTSLGADLRTPAAPNGIVSFEFAGDLESARSMMASWGDEGRRTALLIQRLDFLFLAAYAPGLALLCAAAADRAHAARSRLALPGSVLAWGQLAAGGLDAVENVALLRVLAGSTSTAWPVLAAACAGPKFALVGAGIGYLACWGIWSLRRRNAV